jgi:hypothetical protein
MSEENKMYSKSIYLLYNAFSSSDCIVANDNMVGEY